MFDVCLRALPAGNLTAALPRLAGRVI